MADDKRVGGRVSDEAHAAWNEYVASHRISVASVLEAIGEALAAGKRPFTKETETRAFAIYEERHY